ncbi:MAG: ATP-binding protein [Atopobiaceae bacterium]|nr:ATP-binding protein [Atopobiaceae bacterium]
MNNIAELVRARLTEELLSVNERDEIMEPLVEPARFNRVQIITGMRRSGKTFYLFQQMHKLIERGVLRKHIFYFDFSDDRLPLVGNVMDEVLDEYWRQVPTARTEGCYLFLDEVQDCEGWQATCRRVAETEKVTLTITGSSSKVSSDEIATTFRGRSHSHEMLPLSFTEFVRFHPARVPETLRFGDFAGDCGRAFSSSERTALESLFDDYLVVGGFPAVQADSESTRVEILQGYVRDVVARDVAERLSRPSIPLANQVALLILRTTARELSVNGICETLRASGYKIGWERAQELCTLFRQAYLYFELWEYSRQPLAKSTNPPKSYAVDPGLAYAVSRASQQDVGLRLETAVYLELRRRMAGRRTDSISSYTDLGARHQKLDFLVGEEYAGGLEPPAPYALYQVSLSLASEKTRRRELSSLAAAMARTGIGEGTVVTLRESEDVRLDTGIVHVVPAWRWFLELEQHT